MNKNNMNVLILEDEPAHVEIIRRSLEAAGYGNINIVSSLHDYRKYVSSISPDIVLADLRLPDGAAFDILVYPPEAQRFPILVMTSRGDEDKAVQSMKSGALDYVVKSVAVFEDMPHIIERVLRQWRFLTDRKLAENLMRESEAKFRRLAEEMPVLIIAFMVDGTLTYANHAYCEVLKISLKNLIGKSFFDFFHEDERENIKKRYMRLSKEMPSATFEHHVIMPDGSRRWLKWINNAFFDINGKITDFQSVGEDITERKSAEETLRRDQVLMEAILETAPTLIVFTDSDGRILLFNHACEELTGYKREEVLGKTIQELFLTSQWLPIVQKRFADPYAPELRQPHVNPWLTKSGVEKLIEWRCAVLKSPVEGRPCILGMGVDISERKK